MHQVVQMLMLHCPFQPLLQALSVCLQEYLVRVRYQMTEWFTNILSREQEVVSSANSVSQ